MVTTTLLRRVLPAFSLFLLVTLVRPIPAQTIQELTRSDEFREGTSNTTCLAFLPEESNDLSIERGCDFWLATGSENDDVVRLWEMPGQIQSRAVQHTGGVRCVGVFNADVGELFTGGAHDGRVIIWDMAEMPGEPVPRDCITFQGPTTASVESVSSSNSSGRGGTVAITYCTGDARQVWVWKGVLSGFSYDASSAMIFDGCAAVVRAGIYSGEYEVRPDLLCIARPKTGQTSSTEVAVYDVNGSVTQVLDMPKGRVQSLACQPLHKAKYSGPKGWALIANGGAGGATQVWVTETTAPNFFMPEKTFEQVEAPTEVKLLGDDWEQPYLALADGGDLNLWSVNPFSKLKSIRGQQIIRFEGARREPMVAAVTPAGVRLWQVGKGSPFGDHVDYERRAMPEYQALKTWDPRHFDLAPRATREWRATVQRSEALPSPDGRLRAAIDSVGSAVVTDAGGKLIAETTVGTEESINWPGRWSDAGRFFIVRIHQDDDKHGRRPFLYRVIDSVTEAVYGSGFFIGVNCSVETSDTILAGVVDKWHPVRKQLKPPDSAVNEHDQDDDLTTHPGGIGFEEVESGRDYIHRATGGARDGSVRLISEDVSGNNKQLFFARVPGVRVTSIASNTLYMEIPTLAASFHDPKNRNPDFVLIWNTSSGDVITTLPGCQVLYADQGVLIAEPERRMKNGETTVGRVAIYDRGTFERLGELLMPRGSVTSISYSDSRLVACGGRGGEACVWERRPSEWRMLKCFQKLTAPTDIAFVHPFAALLDNGTVTIWRESLEWKKVFTLPTKDVQSISTGDGTLYVRDSKGMEAWELAPPQDGL